MSIHRAKTLERDSILAVKRSLKRTWFPFFSRFGRLTAVQVETIPLVLSGTDVAVMSPTASGKTEAIVAPTVEMLEPNPPDEILVIYLVPTRALANDILARLEAPLNELGLRTILKHGDKPILPKRIPHFLITTPESLDSLLCRRPDFLRTVRTIIIDEIHLLDNSHRGDQLRVLLYRVKTAAISPKITTHILSATMGNATALAGRYLERFEIVTVSGQREIDLNVVESPEAMVSLARKHRWKKVLCFCNSRKAVEMLSVELRNLWRPYPVLAHHGSLSKETRENAEKVMKSSGAAICVATSTLEIGIDVGDIDVVCLAQPPPTISAFLQRIGRGNRRKSRIRTVAIAESKKDEDVINSMLNNARSGSLESSDYAPDPSVAIQQIYSILFQCPQGIPESQVYDSLSMICSYDDFREIISHLASKGRIESSGTNLYASSWIMDMGERGLIHSNILDSGERKVIDITTNSLIGTVAGLRDQIFVLAGRTWRVIQNNRQAIYVSLYRGHADPARYLPRSSLGAFFPDLPKSIQNRVLK